MSGFEIIGTGHYVPGSPVANSSLSRVMDTSDDWITQRSGIRQRHFAPDGVGASDLGTRAAERAIEAAGIHAREIDYIIFATMTPDYIFPGSGAILGAKLGIEGVPALDIRQQCAAMLFGLQLIDGLIKSGAARTILYVGAEAHAGFMPWEDWSLLTQDAEGRAEGPARERANRHRALAVLFGDGAGALVFRKTDRNAGLVGLKVQSDGRYAETLHVPGGGFRVRPYWSKTAFEEEAHIPRMNGKELFKFAVTRLPVVVRELCAETNTSLDAFDWVLAHQANERINENVRLELGIPSEKMPMNIERFGNTSAGTLPILIDELTRTGKLQKGNLNLMLALGAGIHWGSAILKW